MSRLQEPTTPKGFKYSVVAEDIVNQPTNSLGVDLKNKRVLLRRSGALGDTLFASSVAQAVRDHERDCHIAFSCFDPYIDLMRHVPALDEVVNLETGYDPKFWSTFDLLVDFGGILERGDEAKFNDYYKLHLMRAGVPEWETSLTKFDFYRDPQGFVAIHVGGSNRNKQWLGKYWVKLLSWMHVRGMEYRILGDDKDQVPEGCTANWNMVGALQLADTCEVISKASYFIGTDSGLLHFAGMLGLPTLSMWGPFSPEWTVPNYPNARWLKSSARCSPCYELRPSQCKASGICMRSIKPGSVTTVLSNAGLGVLLKKDARGSTILPDVISKVTDFDVYYKGQLITKPPLNDARVSIVIPSYRTRKYLKPLFESLKENTALKYNPVLVTNGDDLWGDPSITEVFTRGPLGFSSACNLGAKWSFQLSDYICLLNADVTVDKGWLKPLVDYMDTHTDVGVVGNLHKTFKNRIDSLGSEFNWRSKQFSHISEGALTHPIERDMVTFACVLIRRSVWEDLKGIDEGYRVGYWEDSDFCMRVRAKGLKVVCLPTSCIHHRKGGSGAGNRKQKDLNAKRFQERWVTTGYVDKFARQRGIQVHKGRVTACYIVLNESEYIQASLESIYDLCDRIIIVEGGNKYAVKAGWCGPDCCSTDGTVDEIKSFPDPKNKIQLIQGKWKDKTEQRTAYANLLQPGDWMLLMDGDEVFTDEGIWRMSYLMHKYDLIIPGFYLFWNNFHTTCGGIWERFPQMKAVRWQEGYQYRDHTCVSDASGRRLSSRLGIKVGDVRKEKLYCHYSWVKPIEKLRAKLNYYRHQPRVPKLVDDYINKVFLAWRQSPKKIESKYGTHPFGGGLTERFIQEHPDSIRKRLGQYTWLQKEEEAVCAPSSVSEEVLVTL